MFIERSQLIIVGIIALLLFRKRPPDGLFLRRTDGRRLALAELHRLRMEWIRDHGPRGINRRPVVMQIILATVLLVISVGVGIWLIGP